MLVGHGAADAADEIVETAELLGAGVAKALLGKAVLPDELPFVTGPIGLLGSTASFELMEGCDTLLMVGTSFPYSEWLPEEGQARCVQIDLDARMLGSPKRGRLRPGCGRSAGGKTEQETGHQNQAMACAPGTTSRAKGSPTTTDQGCGAVAERNR